MVATKAQMVGVAVVAGGVGGAAAAATAAACVADLTGRSAGWTGCSAPGLAAPAAAHAAAAALAWPSAAEPAKPTGTAMTFRVSTLPPKQTDAEQPFAK